MKDIEMNYLLNSNSVISKLRDQIDMIDNTILELINSRLELVKIICRVKFEKNFCIIDGDRENKILTRLNNLNYTNKGLLDIEMISRLFSIIIKASREIQIKKN